MVNQEQNNDFSNQKQINTQEEPLTMIKYIIRVVKAVYADKDNKFIQNKITEVKKLIISNDIKYNPGRDFTALLLDCVDFRIADYIKNDKLYKNGVFFELVKGNKRRGSMSMSTKDFDNKLKTIRETAGDVKITRMRNTKRKRTRS